MRQQLAELRQQIAQATVRAVRTRVSCH
jgi:hypothetical protein